MDTDPTFIHEGVTDFVSDQVMMGVSGYLKRKSAHMIRANTYVVLDNRKRYIEKRPTIEAGTGTIVITDSEGNVFRRPPNAKIEVV